MLKKLKEVRKILTKGGDYYDYNLLAVIVLLTCFGLVMLYSTSAYVATVENNGNDMFYFSKQAKICAVCIVGAVLVSRYNYHILVPLRWGIYGMALMCMLLVKSPFGVTVNGAKRWLKLGPIQFQPSEIAKLAVVILIPCLIVEMKKEVETLLGILKLLTIGALLAVVTVLFTDNLSTSLIIAGMVVGLLYLVYPKSKYFYGAGIAAVVLGIIVLFYAISQSEGHTDDFRFMRILVWLHPEQYEKEGGYQVMQGLYAIGSGGFFGKGLGNSAQKLGAVPEAQNDMIFAIICEELGVFGGAIVIVLFGYLLYRLFFIAQNAPDLTGSLMVSGIFIHISLQVILNICVVLNLIPTTGITLPFISYGGTSVLFLMMEMAIALSVSRQIKFAEEEKEKKKEENRFYVKG